MNIFFYDGSPTIFFWLALVLVYIVFKSNSKPKPIPKPKPRQGVVKYRRVSLPKPKPSPEPKPILKPKPRIKPRFNVKHNIDLSKDILELLSQSEKALKAGEILNKLKFKKDSDHYFFDVDKTDINRLLYSDLKEKVLQDKSYRWHIISTVTKKDKVARSLSTSKLSSKVVKKG